MMIEIKQIQLHQIAEIKRIIIAVCNEIWQVPEEVIRRYDAMTDLDDVRSHYYENNGTFLVAIADGRVIGSGAIRRLNDDICELKRMWFLKDYRGQGLATKMTQILLDFARKTSYKQVRLDIADQQKQAQALKFYKRLGFYPIERYNDGPCTVFMEKML
jgi:putative acetyltransferase